MNQFRSPYFLLVLGGLLVAGVLAWQQGSIHQLKTDLADLQTSLPTATAEPSPSVAERANEPLVSVPLNDPIEAVPDFGLEQRVAALETSVSQFDQNADHLMDRGVLPPSEAKLADWSATFLNPNGTTQERLSALSLLSRNDAVTPQVAQLAATWLTTSTDPAVTRRLLDSLRGVDDPALKTATLNLVGSAADDRVRDRAILNLREFVDDPQVESVLWQLVASGSSDAVQRRAQDTLRRVPMTEARAANLETRALNPSAALDERLMSLRLLDAGEQDISRIAPTLAQAAQVAADAESRLKYYRAFDDVNDPSFLLPLIQGVEDTDANVRRRATDALVDYRSEPAIAELLRAMAESDPDPRVRQQAARVSGNGRR